MTAKAKPIPADAPALVVFGRDEAGKAHASAFGAGEAELAAKAAELMGLRTLTVRTDLEQALAARVPRGRVFASGKAFVPFIKATLLAELQTAALNSGLPPLKVVGGAETGKASEPTKPAAAAPVTPPKVAGKAPVKQPAGWGDIQAGAIVLAASAPTYAQWFECVVLAVQGEDSFTLRYCDYPNEPPFTRRRAEVGLMHPARTPEPPLEPEPSLAAV